MVHSMRSVKSSARCAPADDEHNQGGQAVMDGLKDLGIAFSNNGGANAEAVAEHTLMLMLMVCKVSIRRRRGGPD